MTDEILERLDRELKMLKAGLGVTFMPHDFGFFQSIISEFNRLRSDNSAMAYYIESTDGDLELAKGILEKFLERQKK